MSKNLQKKHLSAKASSRISNTIIYIILIAISLIWLFPLFGLVLESFRVETTQQVSYLWPKKFGFDNYKYLFTKTDFLKWFKNTGIMGVATAVLQTKLNQIPIPDFRISIILCNFADELQRGSQWQKRKQRSSDGPFLQAWSRRQWTSK